MTDYTSIQTARRRLFALLEEALTAIGRHRYGQQPVACRLRDYVVHRLNRPIQRPVATDRFTFTYHPYRETVSDVRFDGVTFALHEPGAGDVALLGKYPQALAGVATAVAEDWEETVATACPYTDRLEQAREALADAITATRATATLDDLLRAIRTERPELVELLFDVDRPLVDHDETELAALVDRSVESVPYRDDELALLLPERDRDATWAGLPPALRPGPREAYLVGRDDTPTGFFVHAVDGANLTPSSDVTREMIRDALGFDRAVGPETTELAPDENECLRLQGDLCIERLQTEAGLRDWMRNHVRSDIEEAVTAEFVDRYLRRCGLDAYREQLRVSGHGPALTVTLRDPHQATAAIAAIDDVCPDRPGRGRGQSATLDPGQRRRTMQRFERRLSNHLRAHRDEYRETVRNRLERRVETELQACGQLNLPIDNHLVVLGNARRYPADQGDREPVQIVVPDRTSLHVLHDEHPQVDVHLRPGVYTCRLLARGVQPPADRPSW